AGRPNTEARQQVVSSVEIPPAVQSASVWHNRVVEKSGVWFGGHASGDLVQETVGLPLRMGTWRQHALPPQSAGPEQGRLPSSHAAAIARSVKASAADAALCARPRCAERLEQAGS